MQFRRAEGTLHTWYCKSKEAAERLKIRLLREVKYCGHTAYVFIVPPIEEIHGERVMAIEPKEN